MNDVWLAGVDGCPSGWIVALVRPAGAEVRLRLVRCFAELAAAPERPAVVAVDIPIGLPERTGPGGRSAEARVRPLLGMRQSSVFSVPSRAAVYAPDYGAACAIAAATSEPARKISRQLFMIAPKIREVDAVLRAEPALAARVFESHPELAFWVMNGGQPLGEPKKVKSRPYAPGLALRRRLLADAGLPPPTLASVTGLQRADAGEDDLLDALACAVTARRVLRREAKPYPDPPPRDAFGLAMAMWA